MPADLTASTVDTKADATGTTDTAVMPVIRTYFNIPLSLAMEFEIQASNRIPSTEQPAASGAL